MPYFTCDSDMHIDVDTFFEQCDEQDKKDLKELVFEHFDIPQLDTTSKLSDAVTEHLGVLASGLEAKDYVKRTIENMEYKLKMRDFS